MKTVRKTIGISKLSALILSVFNLFFCCFGLIGCDQKEARREQRIYEMVLAASAYFQRPETVRVVSGTVIYTELDEDDQEKDSYTPFEKERGYAIFGHLCLSGVNQQGVSGSVSYTLDYDEDGGIEMRDLKTLVEKYEDEDALLYYTYLNYVQESLITDDFNIEKVNQLLDEYWESK